ncbi:flagellar hook-associated protein 3 [Spirochaeta thermophila DSM 6578]|uniref:Flagellar hook-associated protein 3 n=1 Tax=Winmispira thermophila (strain ATCC 700085 / DSM 6578 / Z-1203) TaxID=869211 RepID=G0GFX4_WINT7|nr:flagellar hook-associated protein 3 [Spirochaeta thermophila]AEJ61667.1 flagellar hook-associated protein 3 [Spirochaeta thermophila DSM 6578]
MNRISTNMPNDDMVYHLQKRERALYRVQNRMSSQTRIQDLRDDPVGAAHAVRYDSFLTRLKRYGENIEYVQDYYNVVEGHLKEGVEILQRIRELTVQAAHGTYTPEDLKAMGKEVDELLEQLVQIANARGPEGRFLFGGARTRGEPFRVVRGNVPGADDLLITGVEYIGDITEKQTEIAEGAFITTGFSGNFVFGAQQQQVYATVDALDYRVGEAGYFSIDGVRIDVTEGDTLYSIVQKINDSAAPVRARIDPVNHSLILETTVPHQLWMEDGEGTVLQDLGIIAPPDVQRPPGNIAASAVHGGGSLFDVVMRVRDAMMVGDQDALGGRGLGMVDEALSALVGKMGEIGARGTRLTFAYAHNQEEIPDVTELYAKRVDLDVSEAIIELKRLEFTHKAALSTAARILPPTLLDFLR